ncbi:hypothetical protein [Chiayiivirga flava]|uniref:Uncharacterized protein n=1 Tax=Chiayiivirga flava TaxID=659595 RepID=A0A7W8FZF5_9GAMM|nr:hypothetical protein [Chiayiivirga flava]MBB5207159.1 hypothetical protein [Chiayiivirga flava]
MTQGESWRESRVPPPGGLERLSHALERTGQAPKRWGPAVSLAMACSLCVAAGIGVHLYNAPRLAFEQALHAALAEAGNAQMKREAAKSLPRELPSSRADVRILLVEPTTLPLRNK